MKTRIFLKNNSHKVNNLENEMLTTEQMLELFQRVAKMHGWKAKAYPAAFLSVDKPDERFGIMSEFEYSGDWSDLLKIAANLEVVFTQGRVWLESFSMPNIPEDSLEVIMVMAELKEETVLAPAALRAHKELLDWGVEAPVYVYKDEYGVKILAIVEDEESKVEAKILLGEIGASNPTFRKSYAYEKIRSF